MSAQLIFLDTQAPLWDYAPNRQWLEARSMRLIRTNGTTVHAVLIETEETPQEVHDALGDTLCNFDSFEVIRLNESDAPTDDMEEAALQQWLNRRRDWQAWLQKHNF